MPESSLLGHLSWATWHFQDIAFLFESKDLSAPPPVLGEDKLGVLSLDAGRYEVTCKGRVPQEILKRVKDEGAITGASLVATLGGPPHGVPPDVVVLPLQSDLLKGKDTVFETAIAWVRAGLGPVK